MPSPVCGGRWRAAPEGDRALMRRLYLQFYVTIVLVLAVFVGAAAPTNTASTSRMVT